MRIHLGNDALSGGMRVAKQHPYFSMTADQCDLRDRQAHLKEAADGLMSEVMEVQVCDSCTTGEAHPCQTEAIWAHRE